MRKICQPLSASVIAVMFVAISAAINSGAADEEIDTAPAMAAAESWLAKVDAGGYAQSWKEASTSFQQAVTPEKWEAMLGPVRGQTGNLIARKMRSATYTRKLADAPDGEYVVSVFDSRFEKIPHAVETVTSTKEPDGQWKVAGYLVKPN
jgi:hypothetical protein